MEFFKIRKDIPFMRHALVFNVISAITFMLAIFFLVTRGLNLGVDFTGGTVLEVRYSHPADISAIRGALATLGYRNAGVENFGVSSEVLIRLPPARGSAASALSDRVMGALHAQDATAELRSVQFVGPEVGSEMLNNGALALLVVALGIVAYLWFRFEWKFGLATLIANLHDVVIILGFFAFFRWQFSLTVLAAVLAIFGYSVNESVVVFDRVRENFRKMRHASVPQVIDNAITRTLSRTIITHGCTQLAVLSMLFFGGEVLHYFALALTIGILFGIYSSALVASPVVMWLGISREDMIPSRKDAAQLDGRP
ncbi:MAG: protein translocase subunit SecF [Pseudomonadota bacterium]|nr:protein translocase subunit SecF [Pseudomonadota bacterium]